MKNSPTVRSALYWLSLLIALLVILFMALAWPSHNVSGQVIQASYETQVFNNVTGPNVSPTSASACATNNTACNIQNYGMGSHWLSYCITGGTVTGLAIELEGSDDLSNWIQISEQATTPTGTAGCGILEAAGYFQWLRVNLITLSGASPKLSAWYKGIGTAIPGGGIIKGFKSSQPVTQVPFFSAANINLKSTPSAISTAAATIGTASVWNPNGTTVFLVLTPMAANGTGANTSVGYGVAAGSSRDIPLNAQANANSTMACSTSANGSGDPATGCVVSVTFKPFVTINNLVNAGGTPQSSSTTVPN